MLRKFGTSLIRLLLVSNFAAGCSLQNFDTVSNFSDTHCPKPSTADAYATIQSYNMTAANVSPFTAQYTYNGTDGITPNNIASRIVNAQSITNINNGVQHGCGPFTGVQATIVFHWGTGSLASQYISMGRYATADFNGDAVSDTVYSYLKITPTAGSAGVQATRFANISAGSTGQDGPTTTVCTANLGGNTTATTDQTLVLQFEQLSLSLSRHKYSDSTNTFISSDVGTYMGSGCGSGTAAGLVVTGATTVGIENIYSGKNSAGPGFVLDAGPQTATVADRPVIKSIKIETRKVYPDFKGGNL